VGGARNEWFDCYGGRLLEKITRRKIAVVTGTRAEYGILRPLLEKIKYSNSLELNLIVTDMHLIEMHVCTRDAHSPSEVGSINYEEIQAATERGSRRRERRS